MNTTLTSIAPTVNEIKRSRADYFIFTSAMLIDINQRDEYVRPCILD